jgi:hypothetical protein
VNGVFAADAAFGAAVENQYYEWLLCFEKNGVVFASHRGGGARVRVAHSQFDQQPQSRRRG